MTEKIVPKMKVLPMKLSRLIAISLADLMQVERDKRYRINMGIWHEQRYDYTDEGSASSAYCTVCLAGSVMACTLKLPVKEDWEPRWLPANIRQLYAIDSLRSGDVRGALGHLYFDDNVRQDKLLKIAEGKSPKGTDSILDVEIPLYEDDPVYFKYQMRLLQRKLERRGL